MRSPIFSKQFKADRKKLADSGRYDTEKLDNVLRMLIRGERLPIQYRDHPLSGEWRGFRDCHIEGDWVLIYAAGEDEVRFARTGTHAELFE